MVTFSLQSLFMLLVIQFRDGYLFRLNCRRKTTSFQHKGIFSASRALETSNDIDELLIEFDQKIRSDDFDAQLSSRLHMNVIMALVKSDVQDRDEDDGSESHLFPKSYLTALTFIVNQSSSLKERNKPLFISANMILKKEGITQILKSVKYIKDDLMSSREIVEIKRKTERVLSQLMTLFIAYNSCLVSGTEKDLLFFTKALLEKTPIHDRHFALLLLCRGLLAPPYSVGSNRYDSRGASEPVGDLAQLIRQPSQSLSESFKNQMTSLGISQPSIAARMLYPFASAAMRSFNKGSSKPFSSKQKVDDWFSNDSSSSDISSSGVEEGIFQEADKKLCLMLQACMVEDTQAEKLREMTGSGDEALTTLRRWICDLAATHFMNDEDGIFSIRDSLPEEIKKNTVAMELLCTERAFCDGKKRDRTRFLSLFEEVGNYLEVISSLREEAIKTPETVKGITSSSSSTTKFTFRVKKSIAAISATKLLPRTHRLRVGMENGGMGTFLGAFNAHKKSLLNSASVSTSRTLTSAGSSDADGGDMWGSAPSSASTKPYNVKSKAATKRKVTTDNDDDDMWATTPSKYKDKQKKEKEKSNEETAPITNSDPALFNLVPQIDEYLLSVISEILKVDESVVQQQSVRDEVDYVFSTWRRPHLLLDYYRMHSSTPEIQSNFRRFLSALLGVSGETVESIRYADAGNKRHFDYLPQELAARWIEGVARGGEVLPGYCDPQTLFMLGEDSNTCMGIRARQKGSNRGLLSMLLHGNCRILGKKDSNGRLTARAVSRLLVDDATGIPVLYVETPYGSVDEDSYVAVYDQAAELGSLLHLPVIYASPPSPALYFMGPRELAAVQTPSDGSGKKITGSRTYHAADWMVEEDEEDDDDENDDDEEDDDDSESVLDEDITADASASVISLKERPMMGKLIDFTEMASHVWIDGIRDPSTGRYLTGRTPLLFITKRGLVGEHGKEEDSLTMGGRPVGALERMQERGLVSLQPPVTRNLIEKKLNVEDIVAVHFASSTAIPAVAPAPAPAADSSSVPQLETSMSVVDNTDEDDDFFGIASTLNEYKRRPAKSALSVITADSVVSASSLPLVADLSLAASSAAIAAIVSTAEEITDKRKSKKQMVVSVQARLAERQRLLLEVQQKRQSVTRAAIDEKEEQKKEYQLRKAALSSSLSRSSTPGGDAAYSTTATASATALLDKENGRTITEPIVLAKNIVLIEEEVVAIEEEDDDDSDGLWA